MAARFALVAVGIVLASACGAPAPVADAGPDAQAAEAETGPEMIQPPLIPTPPPVVEGAQWRLGETGLYADSAAQQLEAGVVEFAPRFELWADGTRKRRFIALPPGSRIDTADMDHWEFPVGTRLWKEFSRDGVRLETRLIQRTGPGPMDYWMGAFVWDADGREAHLVVGGAANVSSTDHDVPAAKVCWSCHQGDPGRVLGFSAIQLDAGSPSLREVAERGWLSSPPGPGDHGPPGDPPTRDALGTLHANCGSCHNPEGIARPDTNLELRLLVADRDPRSTTVHRSTVGVEVQKFKTAEAPLRVAPGQPDSSAVFIRMATRDRNRQMPPLATKHPDPGGLAVVRAWIQGL